MFYFLFAPKFSGSTIMSQTLAHAVDGYLPPFTNNEGQMAPGVKQIIFAQNRWKPTVDYDWAIIKKEWTSLLHQSQKKIFIEGSPPNLMRVASIQKNFEGEMKGVIPFRRRTCKSHRQSRKNITPRSTKRNWT